MHTIFRPCARQMRNLKPHLWLGLLLISTSLCQLQTQAAAQPDTPAAKVGWLSATGNWLQTKATKVKQQLRVTVDHLLERKAVKQFNHNLSDRTEQLKHSVSSAVTITPQKTNCVVHIAAGYVAIAALPLVLVKLWTLPARSVALDKCMGVYLVCITIGLCWMEIERATDSAIHENEVDAAILDRTAMCCARNPLVTAIDSHHCNPKMVARLIAEGGDVNYRCGRLLVKPLPKAIWEYENTTDSDKRHRLTDIINQLILAGAQVPAANLQHPAVVQALQQLAIREAQRAAERDYQRTIPSGQRLVRAAQRGDYSFMLQILNNTPLPLTDLNQALFILADQRVTRAQRAQFKQVIYKLVDEGANPNFRGAAHTHSALERAIAANKPLNVDALLMVGANPELLSEKGMIDVSELPTSTENSRGRSARIGQMLLHANMGRAIYHDPKLADHFAADSVPLAAHRYADGLHAQDLPTYSLRQRQLMLITPLPDEP